MDLSPRTECGAGPPDGRKGESRKEPGINGGLGEGEELRGGDGKAKWPGVGQRLSRSLSSRYLRDRHQTRSPWGR